MTWENQKKAKCQRAVEWYGGELPRLFFPLTPSIFGTEEADSSEMPTSAINQSIKQSEPMSLTKETGRGNLEELKTVKQWFLYFCQTPWGKTKQNCGHLLPQVSKGLAESSDFHPTWQQE